MFKLKLVFGFSLMLCLNLVPNESGVDDPNDDSNRPKGGRAIKRLKKAADRRDRKSLIQIDSQDRQ